MRSNGGKKGKPQAKVAGGEQTQVAVREKMGKKEEEKSLISLFSFWKRKGGYSNGWNLRSKKRKNLPRCAPLDSAYNKPKKRFNPSKAERGRTYGGSEYLFFISTGSQKSDQCLSLATAKEGGLPK